MVLLLAVDSRRVAAPRNSLGIPFKTNTKEYRDAWKALNPDKTQEYLKRARVDKKHKMREKRYGINKEQYEAMLAEQPCCKICRASFEDERPNVDHCHETGKIRGLLCNSCNRALGWFKDSVHVLESAIMYLETNGSKRI